MKFLRCERRNHTLYVLAVAVFLLMTTWDIASEAGMSAVQTVQNSVMPIDLQTVIIEQLKFIYKLFGAVISLVCFIFLYFVYDIRYSIRKLFNLMDKKKDKEDCANEMDRIVR